MELVCEAHGLSKQYGNTYALQNLTMQVPKGSIYGLVGRNGAGKTTLLRILMGLEQADSGRIDGLDGLRLSADSRKIVCVTNWTAFPTSAW